MTDVIESPLFLASALFSMGLFGFLVRRNLIFLFLSIEVMMLAAAYAFVTLSNQFGDVDGQLMFLMILAVAAAELCVGLAIIIRFEERNKSLNADAADHLKG
jgi:NADH-quinone oxidoreductase subunit K